MGGIVKAPEFVAVTSWRAEWPKVSRLFVLFVACKAPTLVEKTRGPNIYELLFATLSHFSFSCKHNMSNNAASVLEKLLQLHKEGILSKEELRQKVIEFSPQAKKHLVPAKESPAAASPAQPNFLTPKSEPAKKRARQPTPHDINKEIDLATTNEPTPPSIRIKKRRLGRPCHTLAHLRKIAKDPTRARFFEQCTKPESLLWTVSPAGHQLINKMLFCRAAQDPMNSIYVEYPGPTRSVPSAKMLSVIKWQVSKDRANWMGKTPKRPMVFGKAKPFDWEAEFKKLQRGVPVQKHKNLEVIDVDVEKDVAVAVIEEDSTTEEEVPVVRGKSVKRSKSIDVDLLKACFECGRTVWLGHAMDMPDSMVMACPLTTDWLKEVNADPYCATCWEKEEEMLAKMTEEHKGIGEPKQPANKPKTKTKKKPDNNKPKSNTKKKPDNNKPKSKTKKQLGGVHTTLIEPKPVVRWKVRLHTHTHTHTHII